MKGTLVITGDPAADKLLNADPLALLIGMLLDQQITMEKAFRGPYDLRERMGGKLDARAIAETDPEELIRLFATPPALHRFPASMGKRVQDLCIALVDDYGGKAERVWKNAKDGSELFENLRALPGFGDQKAKIFVALLGKRAGVQPPGWAEAAGPYSEPGAYRSAADVDGPDSLKKVRAYKQEMKAKAKAKA